MRGLIIIIGMATLVIGGRSGYVQSKENCKNAMGRKMFIYCYIDFMHLVVVV